MGKPSEGRRYAHLITRTDESLFEFVVTLVVIFPESVFVTWYEESRIF
jgi:hypothetical protein